MGRNPSDVIAGGATVVVSGDDSPFQSVIDSAEKRLSAFASVALSYGKRLAALGIGLGAGLVAATKRFGEAGASIEDLAQRTGESVENISALGHAAKMSDASVQDLASGLSKMSSVVASGIAGEKSAAQLLGKLGLSAKDLKGKLPTEQLKIFADKLAMITDADTKRDLVKSIFGGTELVPLLNEGSAGIKKLTDEAVRLGLVMSSQDAAAASKLSDAFDRLYAVAGGIVTRFASTLAPLLSNIVDYLTEAAGAVTRFIAANKQLAPQATLIVVGLTAIGAALLTVAAASHVFGPTIAIAMSAATAAYYVFAAALGIVTTAVSVMGLALKVVTAIVVGATSVVRALSLVTVSFAIVSTTCNLAVRAVGAAIGVTMTIMKAMTIAVAAMTVTGGLLASGMISLGTAFKVLSVAMSFATGSSMVFVKALMLLRGASFATSLGISAIETSLFLLTNPIALAIAGVGALWAALAWSGAGGAIIDSIGGAFSSLSKMANGALDGIIDAISSMPGAVSGLFGQIVANAGAAWDSVTSLARDAFDGAKLLFADLTSTAITSFKGISDAIQAGDIQQAMEIAWTGIKLAWSQGTDVLKAGWEISLIYIEEAFDVCATTLKAIWDKAIAHLSGAFDKFVTGVRNKMQDMSGWLAKLISNTGIFGKTDKESLNSVIQGEYDRINKPAADRANQRAGVIANAGNDPDALKRAADREARKESAKYQKSETTKQIELEQAARAARAAESARQINVNPELLAKSNAGALAAQEVGRSMASAAAQARGSAGAASSAARAVNGGGDPIAAQQLTVAKTHQKATEKGNTLLSKILDKPSVKVITLS